MSEAAVPVRSRAWLWIAVVVLALLHQDFWWWDARTLVFGFIPWGLLYHVLFSLVAGGLWLAAVKFAWPVEIEAWADEVDGPGDEEAADGPAEGRWQACADDAEGRS